MILDLVSQKPMVSGGCRNMVARVRYGSLTVKPQLVKLADVSSNLIHSARGFSLVVK